jgi:hypothetical protein
MKCQSSSCKRQATIFTCVKINDKTLLFAECQPCYNAFIGWTQTSTEEILTETEYLTLKLEAQL